MILRDCISICLLFFLLIMSGCSSPSEKVAPETPVEAPKPVVHLVEIKQMKFVPAEITVKKGDEVAFVNRDIVAHDVTEELHKTWSSSPLATGQTWALVATETVNYYCSIHPVMKGKIIVE